MMYPLNHAAFRRALAESNLSLDSVGLLTGTAKATVFRWKRGSIKRVKQKNLEAVAEVLGVPMAELIEIRPNKIRRFARRGSWLVGRAENPQLGRSPE